MVAAERSPQPLTRAAVARQAWPIILANAAVRNDGITGSIATTGLSVTAFQMFFFAAFALVAALAFGLYARRYREMDYYRPIGT